MEQSRKIILAVTGASGSRYARLLAAPLINSQKFSEIAVIVTQTGRQVMAYEDTTAWLDSPGLTVYDNRDLFAAPASGSAGYDAMVVIPCSMGTLGRIAAGVSDGLLGRAADVMLKERRPLVLVPRELPLGTIHLRNMTALSEAGATICPACPSFYSRPADIDALCMTVVERVLVHLGVEMPRFEWK
ncbi:MAG: UbiX family flavin prenyltransferase [Rikenellaceae bacterium]|nr:UbiX family flavin prenyltransferase [Rikenellaceae bacterium]